MKRLSRKMFENQRKLPCIRESIHVFVSMTKIKVCCGLGNTLSCNKHLLNNMRSSLTLVVLPGPQMADGLCVTECVTRVNRSLRQRPSSSIVNI